MAFNFHRFLMLGAATLAMGTLIAAGCSDSEEDTTGSGGNSTSTNNGGSGATGGGSSMCTPTDACERCAATVCESLALSCCEAPGCQDLVRCVGENCQDAADQASCAAMECPDELAAGSASISQAQALGECLTPELENPTNADCQACADEFGTGGNGGSGGS